MSDNPPPSPPKRRPPLSERGDAVDTTANIAPSQTPAPDLLGDFVEDEALLKAQQEHDSAVEDSHLPGGDEPVKISGIDLDETSLTTITFMRKAGSVLLKGKKPSTDDAVMREIGLFFLAHHTETPIRERSRLFRSKDKDVIDEEIDILMHGVKLSNADVVFDAIVARLEAQTKTLVIPSPAEGEESEGDTAKKT